MRTNIDIDDDLLNEAMGLSMAKTKKETITLALEELIRSLKRKRIRDLKGKIKWEGDLDEIRSI